MPIFLGGSETFLGNLSCVFLSLNERARMGHDSLLYLSWHLLFPEHVLTAPEIFWDAKTHVAKLGMGAGDV